MAKLAHDEREIAKKHALGLMYGSGPRTFILSAMAGNFSTQPPKEPWWKRFFEWLERTIR